MKSILLVVSILLSSIIVNGQYARTKNFYFSKPAMLTFMSDLERSPVVKTITLSNGINLEYAEQGSAGGLPVIFLHGLSDTWRSFELVFPHLSPSIHAYSITLRGHGGSDKPLRGYSVSDFSADVLLFMKKQNIESAALVGHSMGSLVAQELALHHPEKSLGLVLVGTFASFTANPEMYGFRDLINSLSEPIDPAFLEGFQKGTIVREVPKDFVERVVEESAKLPVHAWKQIVNGFFEIDFEKPLKSFQKPVMLIWGDKDALAPARDQETLRKAIPDCRYIQYSGTGHATHWEEPARFANDLNQFITGIKDKSVHSVF